MAKKRARTSSPSADAQASKRPRKRQGAATVNGGAFGSGFRQIGASNAPRANADTRAAAEDEFAYRTTGALRNTPDAESEPVMLLFKRARQQEIDKMSKEELEQLFSKGGNKAWREELFKQLRVENIHSQDARSKKPAVGALRDRVLGHRERLHGSREPHVSNDPDEYADRSKFAEPVKDPEAEARKAAKGESGQTQGPGVVWSPSEHGDVEVEKEKTIKEQRKDIKRSEKGTRVVAASLNLLEPWEGQYPNAAKLPVWTWKRKPTDADGRAFVGKPGRCFGGQGWAAKGRNLEAKLTDWGRSGWQRLGNAGLRHEMNVRNMKAVHLCRKNKLLDIRGLLEHQGNELDEVAFQATMALIRYEVEAAEQRFGGAALVQLAEMVGECMDEHHERDGGPPGNSDRQYRLPRIGSCPELADMAGDSSGSADDAGQVDGSNQAVHSTSVDDQMVDVAEELETAMAEEEEEDVSEEE